MAATPALPPSTRAAVLSLPVAPTLGGRGAAPTTPWDAGYRGRNPARNAHSLASGPALPSPRPYNTWPEIGSDRQTSPPRAPGVQTGLASLRLSAGRPAL